MTPVTMFNLLKYDNNNKVKWVCKVINAMKGHPQFHPLLNEDRTDITDTVPATANTVDTILFTKLERAIGDEDILMLANDTDSSSGIEVLKP